ncbi:MAG: TetR/AcrR family transcriptional regulator [Anaerovoracaceae bacterium]
MESNKKIKSKKNIMHTAKCLFEEKGIENVTFSDVARSADVCRTTVFNHFANTNELMIALCEQEILDIEEYCKSTGLSGTPVIVALFDKLIEDTAYYPVLMTKLTNNTIIGKETVKSITIIEDLIKNNLQVENSQQMTILIMGAYYGLVNHYHLNNKKFEAEKMKTEFHQLVENILG